MENQNSVCFIAKINKISPIEGADNIVQATIEGWNSIVSKGIHNEGDLVLCITTDAVIPEDLAVKWGVATYLRKGFRVRTVKLRGVYSECILIPIFDIYELLPTQGFSNSADPEYMKEGADLMSTLDINKYEPPIVQIQDSKGRKHKYHQNPNFHIYYKFPNMKNTPNMFTEDDDVVITRKIHGTNARYGIVKKTHISLWSKFINFFKRDPWFEYEYVYGSHNVEKGSDTQGFYSTDVWKEIADKYDIKNKLWNVVKNYVDKNSLGKGFIVYGEIYGPGIQGDKYSYNLKEKEFAGFDIEVDGNYLNEMFENVFFKHLKLPQVPLLYTGKYRQKYVDKYVGGYIEGTNVPHEGIVVKCITGDRKKVSKVINQEYHVFAEKHIVPDSH